MNSLKVSAELINLIFFYMIYVQKPILYQVSFILFISVATYDKRYRLNTASKF